MNIPQEFKEKLSKESDLSCINLLKHLDTDINNIICLDDKNIIVKILKMKILLKEPTDFDIKINFNPDLPINHDILLYSLMHQKSLNKLTILFEDTFLNIINGNCDNYLTIIDIILDVLIVTNNQIPYIIEQMSDLIIDVLLKQKYNLRVKIIRDIIPKYIKYSNNYSIFPKLWEKIKINNSIIGSILIGLENYFFGDHDFNIIENLEYWDIIQRNLIKNDYNLRKESIYLLKKSIHLIFTQNKTDLDLIKWNKNTKKSYEIAWKNFFILCEMSSEKQLHLIEPTYKLYHTLKPLENSWKFIITKLFLTHSHSAVVRYAVCQILQNQWYCDDILTLTECLNNNFLYDKELSIFDKLKLYLSDKNIEEYFQTVLLTINSKLNSVPFFYMCSAIDTIESIKITEALELISQFINKSEEVTNLYIRHAIQRCLFQLFIKLNPKDIDKNYLRIIEQFYNLNHLNLNLLLESLNKNLSIQFYNSTNSNEISIAIYFGLLHRMDIITLEMLKEKYLSNNPVFLLSIIKYSIKFESFYLLIEQNYSNIYNTLYETSLDYSEIISILDCINLNNATVIQLLQELLKKDTAEFYLLFYKPLIQILDNQLDLNTLKNIQNNINIIRKPSDGNLESNYFYIKLNVERLLLNYEQSPEIFTITLDNFNTKYTSNLIISVINTLQDLLHFNFIPKVNYEHYKEILLNCEIELLQLKSHEIFSNALQKYIKVISVLIAHENEFLQNLAKAFCLKMFEPSQSVVNIRYFILCEVSKDYLDPNIIVSGLLYGSAIRKTQRIEFDTCDFISEHDQYSSSSGSLNTFEYDILIRSKVVQILLENPIESIFNQLILDKLIGKYKQVAGKRYFDNSQIHYEKLRIFQAIHILLIHPTDIDQDLLCEFLLDCLLNECQQPSITILIQWLIVRIYKNKYEQLKPEYIKPLIDRGRSLGGTGSTAIFPVLYHLIKNKDINNDTVSICLEFLLPYTMGQNFSLRYYAQVTIKYIYETHQINDEIQQKYSIIYKTICTVLDQTVSNKTFNIVLLFTTLPFTLETLFYEIPRLTNISHTEWIRARYFQDYPSIKAKNTVDNLREIKIIKQEKRMTEIEEDQGTNVQQKITVPQDHQLKAPPRDIIVVASLIDRAPNLGGLSRTCEVFGVKQYVLNNLQIAKNTEYTNLSMSSEKWVDTVEVKVSELADYLKQQKQRGFTIVGAEQTCDSKRLDQFRFSKNTVLVLGNEKEGIPPNLIHLLDECIEIPQHGQIRSLNVHVAGALFIWEYTKQHSNVATVTDTN